MSTLRSRPRKRCSAEEVALRSLWAVALDGAVDAVDGEPGSLVDPLEGHHVIPAQALRRRGYPPSVIWDVRNRMLLKRSTHHRHTVAVERVPRSALSPANWEFARELGLDWMLERDYPEAAA